MFFFNNDKLNFELPLVYKLRAWTLKQSASDIKQQQDRIESVPFTATKPSKKIEGHDIDFMALSLHNFFFQQRTREEECDI